MYPPRLTASPIGELLLPAPTICGAPPMREGPIRSEEPEVRPVSGPRGMAEARVANAAAATRMERNENIVCFKRMWAVEFF